ncbi:MAG: MobF family relaxase [Acidobacteriaceae bacterium]|nr:MobF family relaxase [Acidobacteriaceae bacterium]
MLTISKPLSAGQAQTYHAKEFTAAEQNYWKQGNEIVGEWQGRMAGAFGLTEGVAAEDFALLSNGQHPRTWAQLVQHRQAQEYKNAQGETVKPVEHRAGWDATFSAPKSVSLTALVGGDDRVRDAHRAAVTVALSELERYTQARIGGNHPPESTGRFVAAKFEHDTARPVNGYAAPQLHTHAVVFNMTERQDGSYRALQPQSLFASQQFATAVYQSELMYRLKNLGYEIQPGRSGAPEIKGYSPEYLAASSPRRQQIEEALARSGFSSPEAAQIAAHTTRDRKQIMTPEKVLAAHRQIADEFGNQADRVVKEARERAEERQHTQQKESDPQQKARESVSFSKARNFERDAVIDERAIMRDALRRGMGEVTFSEVAANFHKREAAGEFLKVEVPGQHSATRFTTRDMLHAERSNIDFILSGKNTAPPIMEPHDAAKYVASVDLLNQAQRRTAEEVLTTSDRVHGLQGYAGSGKTTTLKAIREGAERGGYAVEGFAPTNRAANQLREAGVNAETLQKFLTRGGSAQGVSDPEAKRLFMVDESSLTSTKQIQSFFEKIGPSDRVLLIGDVRQHQGVDAGKPFEQLQDAGLKTSKLDEIIRQKDAGLHRAVEHLSQGQTADGVRLLKEQGRVYETPDRPKRVAEIAREYAAQPVGTIVISPDNASRVELNQAIRSELRERGGLHGAETEFKVLAARSELNSEDRKWAAQYQAGDVLQYTRGSKELGIAPLGYATVRAIDEQANRLTVERQDGQQVSYDPKRLRGITAYRETPRRFANGDRLQFTTNDRELGISNRQLGTVEKATPMEMRVRLDGEKQRTVSFRPEQMRHFDHGYAVTSHSSQGLTADRVLINVDVSAHRDLVNQRFAYVAVSRAAFDVRLYTDDSTRLAKDLGRDVSKTAAIELNLPKEKTMNFQNEHAHIKEVNQEGQKMPVEVYASTLSPEVIREDLRFAERQLEQGISRTEATSNLIGDHVRRTEAEPSTLSLAERYANRVTELVTSEPEQPIGKVLESLQPTSTQTLHWEPAIAAIGAAQTDTLVWRREHGDIQSYQQTAEPKGWLHIDNAGQFFDRGARPLLAEEALAPLGLSLAGNPAIERAELKGFDQSSGSGLSL